MASLKLQTPHVIYELRPTAPDHRGLDENELLIQGELILTLDKPRTVSSISISFVNSYSISQSYEASTVRKGVLTKRTPIAQETAQEYQAGDNVFNFQFSIPSTTAPYERCKYGHVQAKLKAKVKFAGLLSREISETRMLYLFYIPSAKGSMVESLALRSENFSDDLGPWLIQAESDALIVAGLINFRFAFPAPPKDFLIEYIHGSIGQNFSVKDPEKPDAQAYQPPTQFLALFHLNGSNVKDVARGNEPNNLALKPLASQNLASPFAHLTAGNGDSYTILIKLPNDDFLRGTTSPLSQTPIRVAHDLIVTIRYRVAGGSEALEAKLTMPLQIAHCHSHSGNLLLPEYSDVDHNKLTEDYIALTRSSKFSARHSDCMCGKTLEEVLSRAHDSGLDRVWNLPERPLEFPKADTSRSPSPAPARQT